MVRTRVDVTEIMTKIDAAIAILERIDGTRVTSDLKNNAATAEVSRALQAAAHELDFARILVMDEFHAYRSSVARERRRGTESE